MGTSKHRKGQKQKSLNRRNEIESQRKGKEIQFKRTISEHLEAMENERNQRMNALSNHAKNHMPIDAITNQVMNPRAAIMAGIADSSLRQDKTMTSMMLNDTTYKTK